VTKPIRPYLLEQVVMKYLPADKVEKVEAKDGDAKKKDGNRFIDRIQETSTISFPGWVFQIDEINVFSAISFCGSPEMFFASLQMFMKDSEALLSDLETLKKNRDGEAFAFHMHKLKSNSRLIGFDCASRLAEFMELCHKRGEMENFWYYTTDIIDMIRTVREELLEIDRTHENAFYAENDENRADEQPELSYEETIEQLREMVDGFDYDSAAKMTENLEKVAVKPEELEFARRFREALDDFNWDSMQALMK
jgi:HPt (histidine-containing phosphotransfer) domain-containing protein